MDDNMVHVAFIAASAGALVFLLYMRHRLRTRYADDDSKQMQSMLGFIRGMAIFAGIVLALTLADLARVSM